MKSLLGRLSLGLGLSLVAVFILQWWVVNVAVRTVTENYVVSRLEHDSENILLAITEGTDGALQLDSSRIDAIYHGPLSGHYFLLRSGDWQSRSRSLWDQDFPRYDPRAETQYINGPEHQRLLVTVRHYQKQGRRIEIAVAEDMTPLQEQLAKFEIRYALLSLLVMLLVIGLQALIARRSLRPLNCVIEDIERLEQGGVTELRETVPAEIHPLVAEFNRLLRLMRERLDRSRSAVGNLAHAMKTPLTVLTHLQDDKRMQQQPELRLQLQQQTDAMRQLIDRQLKRARLAGASTPGLQFDPAKELAGLAEILRMIYSERGINIELQIPSNKLFAGDREDLLELFGNLLDNACKWADKQVLLKVQDCPGLCVTIEDDGPGCPREQLQELDQRGRRIDESTLGHGLGLAIVRDIVEHYGGTLTFGRAELGGFCVEVSLPGKA